jgi:hypothetical protein
VRFWINLIPFLYNAIFHCFRPNAKIAFSTQGITQVCARACARLSRRIVQVRPPLRELLALLVILATQREDIVENLSADATRKLREMSMRGFRRLTAADPFLMANVKGTRHRPLGSNR